MESVTYDRVEVPYQNLSERFKLPLKRDFSRQYAHIYAVRLFQLKPIVTEYARRKWGNDVPISCLADIVHGVRTVVIGTLYKQQELKPSILTEISEEQQVLPLPAKARYTAPSDTVILEDELQRILLVGKVVPDNLVTGIVAAVLGTEDENGRFDVEDVCFAEAPAPEQPRKVTSKNSLLAIVSGLDLGGPKEPLLNLSLMIKLLTGKIGDPAMQSKMASVSRVIIAGNSLSEKTQDRGVLEKARYLLKNVVTASVVPVQLLDEFLFQLTRNIKVDLMPGANDPSNFVLPQQPLHRCMFPRTQSSNLNLVPNPYCCSVGGRVILGTSGQPTSDILRNSGFENSLDALEHSLEWRHIAPTAPDTQGSYPYDMEDPFILSESPDVYFAANQDTYATKIWKGSQGQRVRLLSIPKFCETGTFVLLNVETLEPQPVTVNFFS